MNKKKFFLEEKDMKYDFTGKVILASGAASGMGFLACKRVVEFGGSAVLCDISEEALAGAVEEINAIREGSAIGVKCDVRKYDEICHVRDEAVRVFGRIDILAPFAGGAELRMLKVEEKDFCKVPIEVYDWGIDVNLKSQLYFDHAVLPVMIEQKSGTIVHIGSVTGEEGSWTVVAYSTAKSGVMNGLTKSIALYAAPYGITCNCIAPGPVMTRASMANMITPLGRAAEPDEIVDFMMYLASPEGSFFTGQSILIDGGRSIMHNRNNSKGR